MMKRSIKRIVSVVLCLTILLCLGTFASFTTSAQTQDIEETGTADFHSCVDSIRGGGGLVHIKGWVYDKNDINATITLHVYIGGPAGSSGAEGNPFGKADSLRSDVNRAYGCGDYHGIDCRITTSKRGRQAVYVYAVNGGSNKLIGSATVEIGPENNPTGVFDTAEGKAGMVHVDGWAFDKDYSEAAIHIHIYIGGKAGSSNAEGHNIVADTLREDVDNAHKCGKYHGFYADLNTEKTGTQEVYAYAINIFGGSNVEIGHKTVNISSGGNGISYESISLDQTKSVNINTAKEIKYFRYTPSQSGTYTFYSIGTVDAYGYLYGSSMDLITYNDDGGSNRQFKVTCDLTAGTTYYFGAGMYSSGTGSYSVKLIKGSSTVKKISDCQCSLSQTSFNYDGTAKTPSVTVRDGSATLVNGTHYTVSYRNNTAVGTASAIITGRDNYTGSVTLTFCISRKTYNVDYTRLTFHFGNSPNDMGYTGNKEIPYYNYARIFGDNQRCRTIFNRYHRPWAGGCFGFTAMSSILYAEDSGVKPSQFNGVASIWNLNTMDWSKQWNGNVRDWIDGMMVSQYSGLLPGIRQQNIVWNSDNRSKLNAIRDAARNVKYTGKPINLCIWGQIDGQNSGHSIVAYGTRIVSSTREDILCYDPNYVNEERVVQLTTDTSGNVLKWYYNLNKKYNWGTGYGYDAISYVPFDEELMVFKGYEKNNTYTYSMMNVSSESFSLYDEFDKKVAEVINGEVISESEEIYKIMPVWVSAGDDINEEEGVSLQMPVGRYKVVNDLEDKFTVEMVNTDRSTTVTTSSDTVEFMVSDEEKINEVNVQTVSGDTYDIMVSSSDEDEWAEIHVSGVSQEDSVSASMDNGSVVLDNCTQAEITVNGISIDEHSKVDTEEEDGSISFRIPENGIVGDVNFDGIINVDDVTQMKFYLAYIEDFTDSQKTAGDIDKDGNVTICDVTLLQEYLAKYDVDII